MRSRPTLGIITWTNVELSGLLEDEDSHVHEERVTKHLALLPCHLSDLNAAIRQHFDESINVYDAELNGLVLAYKNPKVTTPVGSIMYDTYFIHIDVEAIFYVFRPKVGQSIKGFVNKKGTNHIGALVHKAFNVSIPQPDRLENYPDRDDVAEWPGNSVRVGQQIRFTLEVVDFKSRLPYMRGSLQANDYLRGCQLFNEEIAATLDNEFNGSDSLNVNGDCNSDEKNKAKTGNKRIVFNSGSENETDTERDQVKKLIKKEKVKTPSKKRKRSSVSSGAESETEALDSHEIKQQRDSSDFEMPKTPSKKKEKKLVHVNNNLKYNGESSENSGLNGTDDQAEVTIKKHKKKSNRDKGSDEVKQEETCNERKHKTAVEPVTDKSDESKESDVRLMKVSKKRKSKLGECVDTEDERNYKSTINKNLNHLLDDGGSSLATQKSKSRKRKFTENDDLTNTDDEKNYKKTLKKVKVSENGSVTDETGDSVFVVPKTKSKKKKRVAMEDPSLMDTEDEKEYKSSLKPLIQNIKEESPKKKHKKAKKHKSLLAEDDLKQEESENSVDHKVRNINFDE